MVKDTQYNLELHLRRVEENITSIALKKNRASGPSVNLEDEKEVTRQCLRICQDARNYIETLSDQESILLEEKPQISVEGAPFEAQLRTRQALLDNQETFAETIGCLQQRLKALIQTDGPAKEEERSQLQADVDISRQCLDVCKLAGEVSRQKVYRIGEVIAEDESDQVVVTTLADLFDIQRALSKNKSAQLIGSMGAENLQHLTEKRYSSRFGTSAKLDAASLSAIPSASTSDLAFAPREQSAMPRIRQGKATPNETRKRFTDDAAYHERDTMTDGE